MSQPSNYIVFQCYGNESIFHECAFALLSLSNVYPQGFIPGTEIWIYTDNPEWFSRFKDCPLPLQYRKIDSALISQWKGATDFVHRVKIEVLRDMTEKKSGNILYLDTDVVFLKPVDELLERIENNALYMHTCEGKVSDESNAVFKKLSAYLRLQKHFKSASGNIEDVMMWNAGVLGFNTNNRPLLNDVLSFTDKIHAEYPKHVVEQFAFSLYFQQAGNVKAAAPYILHYWNLKEVRTVLASFFSFFTTKTWSELVNYSKLIQMHVLMQEQANFYSNRSITGKLQKQRWQPMPHNWNELMKQL